MPAVANMVGKETPRVAVVLVLHEDPDPVSLIGLVEHVFLPQDRQEERTGRVHDGDVGKQPAAVVGLQEFNDTEEEGVLRNRSHRVVGNTCRDSTAHPRRVSEQRIQATVAALYKLLERSRTGNGHEYIRRQGQCRFHHSGPGQSNGSSRRVEWGICSHRTCPRTRGILWR